MVMTSQQIAAQSMQFQQQGMMQMQHSGMLSQFAGGMATRPDVGAEQLTGSLINRGAAIGAPLAMGGLMLAGMDPISLGVRGAWGARGAGMLGAGAAGMAAAAPVAAGLMGAQYVGGQMMTGMQEQQALSQQLRGAYGHMNAHGMRGFTTPEMSQIGTQFRGMTMQRGPGGEFVTMDELGKLASSMGRMGMAQGVRDAKEFQEKFKQMLNTVKEVATAFSTSLEQAQQIMSSMRGSGVFGRGRQAAMSQMMRGAAVGGGLAVEELTQAANIGSQISRSVGGLGRSGAVAGVRTLGGVGAALQSGVLSEEDVYNATGLTGAAGRQAMASTMMQQEAQFFRGGLGRRVLASMAGKDGQIDPEMVERYARGGVGTGATMQQTYAHLGQTGRANFIRNEGRLRGEAMAAFGGLGRAYAARGWLSERGMDLDNMGDREMLFFQRKFKMDRDQADSVIKMARDIDTIRLQQREAGWDDQNVRGLEIQRRGVGIEGVKRKLEDARQKVNNSLQQLGADFMAKSTDAVERTINYLSGEYVRQVVPNVGQYVTAIRTGDVAFQQRQMGAGRTLTAERREQIGQFFGGMTGREDWIKQNSPAWERAGWATRETTEGTPRLTMGEGIAGVAATALMGAPGLLAAPIMSLMRRHKAGEIAGPAIRGDVMWQKRQMKSLIGAAREGMGYGFGQRVDETGKSIGDMGPAAERLRSVWAATRGSGKVKVEDFRRRALALGPELPDELREALQSDDPEQWFRAYGDVGRGLGFENVMESISAPEESLTFGGLRALSQGAISQKFGERLFGATQAREQTGVASSAGAGGLVGILAAGVLGPVGGAAVGLMTAVGLRERAVTRAAGGLDADARQRVAGLLLSDEGKRISRTTLYGTEEERRSLQRRLTQQQSDLGGKLNNLTTAEKDQVEAIKVQRAGLMLQGGRSVEDVASELGMSVETVREVLPSIQAGVALDDYVRQVQSFQRAAGEYQEEREGLVSGEEAEKRLRAAGLSGKGLEAAVSAYRARSAAVISGAKLGEAVVAEEMGQVGAMEKAREGQQRAVGYSKQHVSEMSTADLKKYVSTNLGDESADLNLRRRESFAAASRSRVKGAGFMTLARGLGAELSEEDAKRIYGLKGGTAEETTMLQTRELMKTTGVQLSAAEGKDAERELMEVVAAMKKDVTGKGAAKELEDVSVINRKELAERRKEKEEASYAATPEGRALTNIDKNTSEMVKTLGIISTNTANLKKGKEEEGEE